jgi:trehalose 6-phosphate synthase
MAEGARDAESLEEIEQLHNSLEGRALIIGVDRLDYSKGLPERFEAVTRICWSVHLSCIGR